MNVPEIPVDPTSHLTPRNGRSKHPAEGTPDRSARPAKRASRVMQYDVSSDEEVAKEPVLTETPPAETTVPTDPTNTMRSSLPAGVNELHDSTFSPSTIPSLATAGEPSTPFVDQSGSSGHLRPIDKSKLSRQPGPSASGSGVAREASPADPTEAGEKDESVSLSDFTAAEICSYLINNDVYIGESWENVKGNSCKRKMEFFFNCHSLVGFLNIFIVFLFTHFLTLYPLFVDDV